MSHEIDDAIKPEQDFRAKWWKAGDKRQTFPKESWPGIDRRLCTLRLRSKKRLVPSSSPPRQFAACVHPRSIDLLGHSMLELLRETYHIWEVVGEPPDSELNKSCFSLSSPRGWGGSDQ